MSINPRIETDKIKRMVLARTMFKRPGNESTKQMSRSPNANNALQPSNISPKKDQGKFKLLESSKLAVSPQLDAQEAEKHLINRIKEIRIRK